MDNHPVTTSSCHPSVEEGNSSLEQPENAPAPADNAKIEGSNILGKFASPAELSRAYESLQGEFTKKCQQLATLQQGIAGAAKNLSPNVETTPTPKTPTLSRDEIIRDYLTSLSNKQQAPVVITTNNDFAFGAAQGPRSIREVSKLAENYFKNKELT